MLAYGYVRVSTTGQEDGTSLDSQERAIRQYAADHGLNLIQCWREVFTGAELFDRPVLNQARAGIRARSVNALIVYAIDRLSRDVGHLAFLVDECERYGVALHFVTEQFDATPEGKLMQSVRSYAAEVERLKIRERTVRGKRSRLEAGHLPRPSLDLYGYRLDRTTGRREIVEAEARIVRRIYELSAHQSLGALSIARRLETEGIPPPTLNKRAYKDDRRPRWSKSTILRILREPAYAGQSYGWRWSSSGKGRRRWPKERPRSEWILLDNRLTPAIIPEQLWQSVQSALADRKRAPKGQVKIASLLRGHIWCTCGQRRIPDQTSYSYRCASRYSHEHCRRPGVPMRRVEAWAWGEVTRILSSPEMIERIIHDAVRRQSDQSVLKAEIDAERKELKRIEQQQARLVEQMLAAESEWMPVFKSKQADLTASRRRIETRIKELQGRMGEDRRTLSQADQFALLCERIRPHLESFGLKEKRTALAALNVRIVAAGREEWSLTISPVTL